MTQPSFRLPAPGEDLRWTPTRKGEVLRQIATGELTEAQALSLFNLTAEELASWQVRARRYGARGLSVTKLQEVGRRG